MKTNVERLVKLSVQGEIKHPCTANPYYTSKDGTVSTLPAMGGITYNVKVGDPAFGWVADHVEPGVTMKNEERGANDALNLLSCIGNEAVVVSGDAKGTKGYVTGTHGGVEHIIINFYEHLDKMLIGDKILVKAHGQGLKLEDYPAIKVCNIDPGLFSLLGVVEENGKLKVPVAGIVPAYLMGSGMGDASSNRGDYDITTTDMNEIEINGLGNLRLGDIVMLRDCDNSFGRAYLKGSVSIGVVIHGDSVRMGHGPGVTTIMTCKAGQLEGVVTPGANIGDYMKSKI